MTLCRPVSAISRDFKSEKIGIFDGQFLGASVDGRWRWVTFVEMAIGG
jgi:hypothetical protein